MCYSCKQEPALTTFNTRTLFSVEVRSCPLWQTQMQCNFLQYTFSQYTFPEVNSIPLAEERSEHRQIKAEESDPDTLIQFPVTPVSTDSTRECASVTACGRYCITCLFAETCHLSHHFHMTNILSTAFRSAELRTGRGFFLTASAKVRA